MSASGGWSSYFTGPDRTRACQAANQDAAPARILLPSRGQIGTAVAVALSAASLALALVLPGSPGSPSIGQTAQLAPRGP
jgi:hypothetical protein